MEAQVKIQRIQRKILIDFLLLIAVLFMAFKGFDYVQKINLADQMASDNNDQRKWAMDKFHTLTIEEKKQHVDSLIRILENEHHPSRYLAAHALGQTGHLARKAIPELTRALRSNDYDLRWNAVHALINLGPKARETAPALYPFLKAENKYERASAAIALVAMEETTGHLDEIMEQLKAALRYNDKFTRQKAMTALGQLGPVAKEAVPELLNAAQSSDDKIRRYAVWVLGRLGENNQKIMNTLLRSISDEDHNVRLNALLSIDVLDPTIKQENPLVKMEWQKEKSKGNLDSALLFSAFEGDSIDAQALINLGANVNAKGYYTGKTALMIAAQGGHPETVQTLLKNGADPDMVSDHTDINSNIQEPFLPLNMSFLFKDLLLPEFFSKPKINSYEGKTALTYAVESEFFADEKSRIIGLLLDF